MKNIKSLGHFWLASWMAGLNRFFLFAFEFEKFQFFLFALTWVNM